MLPSLMWVVPCIADTHRQHMVLLPLAQELQMGKSAFQTVLDEAAAEGILLPESHPAVLQVCLGPRVFSWGSIVAFDTGFGGVYHS